MRETVFAALRATVLVGALCASGTAFPAPTPDCQCRDPEGERRDLGTVACVDISGTSWLVRCEMSTNTPYWRRLGKAPGCSPLTPVS